MSAARSFEDRFKKILETISEDEDEQGYSWAASLILLSTRGWQPKREGELKQRFEDRRDYWTLSAILRALREFPHKGLTDQILGVMKSSEYLDLKSNAIRALRAPVYKENLSVVRALGEVVLQEPSRFLRLDAVQTLADLGNPEAEADLLQALNDADAEIRVQASKALAPLLGSERALAAVVQQALRTETPENRERFIEAIRRIDPDRRLAAEMLSKELGAEDRARSDTAERILIDLGGWAAVQRLGQRRSTLDSLDRLLAESETVVKSTFKDTIRQARINFYFAMVVNALVVGVGIALVILAINQLIADPTKLQSWLVPGGAGVVAIIINLGFNNPRHNAREDLAILMNVNVIFLGFLRQLNEIDATFKHAFIENEDFGTEHMKHTVQQIEEAMSQALEMAAGHLYLPKPLKEKVAAVAPKGPDAESDS